MRILHVSLCDNFGGAHKIAYELFRGHRLRGQDSYLAVGVKTFSDPDILEIPNNYYRNPWSRFWRTKQKRLTGYQATNSARVAGWLANMGEPGRWLEWQRGIEDFNYPATQHLPDLTPKRPDLIHAHNLHGGYFDLSSIAELSNQIPIVLTLHDEWTFTGHCSYTLGCDRWEIGCGNCPHLDIYPAIRRDGSAYNWQRKREIYSRSKLYLSASSRWLLDRALRSMMKHAVVESRVITYGIDLKVFKPGDKHTAREELGLPQEAQILLFIANKTYSNPFKDYATMEDATRRIAAGSANRETVFISLGEERKEQRIGSAVLRYVGFLSDPEKVARFYQASDLYLHAAKSEAFGLVMVEAQACGVPVVATAVGGIPEVVEDGHTGFLVHQGDSEAMAARALQLLNDEPLRKRMSEQAINTARRRFCLERHVDDYLNWYQEILKKDGSTKAFNCYSVV